MYTSVLCLAGHRSSHINEAEVPIAQVRRRALILIGRSSFSGRESLLPLHLAKLDLQSHNGGRLEV